MAAEDDIDTQSTVGTRRLDIISLWGKSKRAEFDRLKRNWIWETTDLIARIEGVTLFSEANESDLGLTRNRYCTSDRIHRSRATFVPRQRGDRIKRSAQMDQTTGNTAMENAEDDGETCEIVSRFNVTLGVEPNQFQGYMVQAIKNNNGTAILFLTDVYGFEDSDTRDFAYRLACFGYNVLVPDLFRGAPRRSEDSMDDYEKWREQHPPARVAGDIDVATRWLENEILGGKLGIIGFCFGGGRLIETLAREEETLFAAAAFCYGTRFDTSLVKQIRIPLLIISGDGDDKCSVSTVTEMEQLAKEGTRVKIYPGFGHAFVHRPKTTEEDVASEDAFTEIRHWFHQTLLPVPSSE
ncbi:hypothetical protein R1flu_019145 [Riccia fluitans]|uniref:Carboxymethylenebutenolidase homolog n=1 Tax=Riccia fluitans TaxID=41844 RepID=A0ABD1ZHT6_9MARC